MLVKTKTKLMRGIKFVIIFSFIIGASTATAQEESFPCEEANPKLKKLFMGESIESLYVHNCYGAGLHAMASSYLKASGTPPKIIEDPEGMEPPEDSDYVNWTCTYSMGNIGDNNPATTWVEGVKGYGIGEVLIVPCLDLTQPVKIWAGYGKSESSFINNSRPKNVRLVIVQAEVEGVTQYGTIYENLRMVSQSQVELKDINGYQSLQTPYFKSSMYEFESEQRDHTYFLGLEILDVYKGSKWDDTCISELRNE